MLVSLIQMCHKRSQGLNKSCTYFWPFLYGTIGLCRQVVRFRDRGERKDSVGKVNNCGSGVIGKSNINGCCTMHHSYVHINAAYK